jgi:hypothetical protein
MASRTSEPTPGECGRPTIVNFHSDVDPASMDADVPDPVDGVVNGPRRHFPAIMRR